jgi:hypothetical protein
VARRSAPSPWRRPAAADCPLASLRRKLVDAASSAAFATGDRRDLAPLCRLALRQIDALRQQGVGTLPSRVGLFGRAHITVRQLAYRHPGGAGSVKFLDLDSGRRVAPPRLDMRYGAPVAVGSDVTTEDSGALLLFGDGGCAYVPPFHTGTVGGQVRPRIEARRLDMAC